MACQRTWPSTKDEWEVGQQYWEGMTMRKFVWSALAATCLLAAGSAARAQDDTFRLGGPSAQADIEGGTDSELVYYRGGYGRGFYGGHYGGYGRGFYGGYGGYGRGFYGYGRGYGVGYYGGW